MGRVPLGLGATALVVSLVSCSSGSSYGGGETTAAAPTSTPAPAAGGRITISGFRFTAPDSVAPGAKITVRNADSAPHTVTATTGKAFDAQVGGGETATFTAPSKPGSYAFFCSVHPNMKGTLVVR